MGDKAKLNPFQSLDDGTEANEPNSGYEEKPGGKKKKAPARASRAPPPANPFTDPPQQPPAPPAFTPAPNPFVQQQQQQPPNPFTDPPPQSQSQPTWLNDSSKANTNSNINNVQIQQQNVPPPQSTQPSWLSDPKAVPPPPTQASYNNTDLSVREAEIQRREQALDARERDLEAREANLGKAISRIPNWPKWPKPIIHHDIDKEIPADKRRLVRQAYIFWFVKFLFVVWNLVVAIALLIVGGKIGDLILSIVYIFIWNLVLFLNYRLLYSACRRRRALSFVFFLFWFSLEILGFILWGIGIRGSGMSGILWMIWAFDKNHEVVAFMCLVNVIFCGFAVVFNSYIWIRTRSFYASDGGSEAAKKQAAASSADIIANSSEPQPTSPPFASRQTGY